MPDCKQMRRKLVTHSTLNFGSGTVTPNRTEWVVEPCGVPIFDDEGSKTGFCRSCRTGWTHEHNYPVAVDAEAYDQA